MSVYFSHPVYADHHVEKAYRAIEKHTKSKKYIQIVGGDFNAEFRPGIGIERISVGQDTLNEGNKRGDWMKQWMMLQKLCAGNPMYRKTHEKQGTYRTPEGAMKKLDYILVDKKTHRCCSADAETNDMIHMGSYHRSVMTKRWTKEDLGRLRLKI